MDDWSDEEGEILPDYVDEYYFVDQSDTPVKFCVLPIKWDDPVFLRGNTDGGDESFHKLAKAWKFDLSDEHPKIDVLLHGMHWITLQKPRKSYETLARTTLVTLRCLHFVKRNPDASTDELWNSLEKMDRIQPSELDLSDHVSLLCEAMKRDEGLTISKELPTHHQQDAHTPKEQNFTVDNEIDEDNISDDESESNLQFDTVCSICDNGGYILFLEFLTSCSDFI
uniref:RFTS domain-containing protein n=1 Tax=Noccaea caerulescens TaxID=107243 RepID=A0A1J3K8R6_NOCCA